jgi:hypothetical protein
VRSTKKTAPRTASRRKPGFKKQTVKDLRPKNDDKAKGGFAGYTAVGAGCGTTSKCVQTYLCRG